MVKRVVKRRVRNVFKIFFVVFFGIIFVVVSYFAFYNLAPFFSNISPKGDIVKPIGRETEMSDLKVLLDEKNLRFEKITESSISGVIEVKLKDGPIVHFSKSDDVKWQVSSLQLILTRLTIDNKKINSIDLSSGRPIVKFGGL